ncbi:hypothetical protein E6P09_07655 [Haloferax mediterranei ATCC 33500]|uniref:DUF6602 domain-containing protein n=1 Tax=Haloferax mediterranei (strain ATCC 33500 / DSM 1411 / JCM 8866 / NBRC 14739 / NCIMB 2177 / R-4) TaxID=523841 RepID=M0IZE8_HALMT|nr:DUF6602 domain-containing protein [Haloferax mediterranei]AHZ21985.1 hypothetical protein BM92_04605 [Haloferax mediterranei ATCC 33500]EMA02081.1 hypothetical protein C439_05860 [Haloferax mediterranei ATCC 33500]MDX5988736.1 DUF6602 domain-containing protein [Haloferax mediterranei ATCC 33500]QCQ75143.1 hypothetical protein E6P09_07655 [Haloferax mediterranei ATCC 33500]
MSENDQFNNQMGDLMRSEAQKLVSEFNQIRSKYSHGGLKGSDTEDIVQEFLEQYLPKTYGFGNGQIIDSSAQISKEVDIAICNQFHPFTYSKNGRGMLFAEGVDAVVEVKSVLNESHLRKSIKNCRSVRSLNVQIPAGTHWWDGETDGKKRMETTPYAIFAFECPYTLKTLDEKREKIIDDLDIQIDEAVDLIYAIDTGLIVLNRDIDDMVLWGEELGIRSPGYVRNTSEPDLLQFLLFLQDKMPNISYIPNIMKQYIDFDIPE